MTTPNTFRFGEGNNIHKLGNKECRACRWDTPQRCTKCNEGLVHIELSPKKIGAVFLFHCDVCAGKGTSWKDGGKATE